MGIDVPALSRLETDKTLNPTIATLHKWPDARADAGSGPCGGVRGVEGPHSGTAMSVEQFANNGDTIEVAPDRTSPGGPHPASPRGPVRKPLAAAANSPS